MPDREHWVLKKDGTRYRVRSRNEQVMGWWLEQQKDLGTISMARYEPEVIQHPTRMINYLPDWRVRGLLALISGEELAWMEEDMGYDHVYLEVKSGEFFSGEEGVPWFNKRAEAIWALYPEAVFVASFVDWLPGISKALYFYPVYPDADPKRGGVGFQNRVPENWKGPFEIEDE